MFINKILEPKEMKQRIIKGIVKISQREYDYSHMVEAYRP